MLKADRLNRGRFAIVRKVEGKGVLKKRLYEIGCTPGTGIVLLHKAPFGDPLLFIVRDSRVVMRRSEAATILAEYDQKQRISRILW